MAFGGDWRLGLGGVIVASSVLVCTSIGQDPQPLPVEPEAQAAFDRAMARYPEPIREHLSHVELIRERSYGVPIDAPLMARLMGDAVYAYYSMNEDSVFLLDAGLAERSRWLGGDESEEEVAGLMVDIGLMEEGGDVPAAWDRFVETVQGWPGEAPIEGAIRFGDARVLDRFVRLGVGKALAREWEEVGLLNLEQQMIHELAHAVQLDGQLGISTARMYAWGTLSGWVRADRNEPFDGFHSGLVMLENPAVLGRLLVSDARGEGLYAHASSARFVNRYARYDAREDYAESVRLFMEDPGRLIRIDPVKFMFINALGYNISLTLGEPGPLWISAEQIEERGWHDLVQQGARELLAGREGIQPDPRTVAALIRAHAGLLSADGLPRWEVFQDAPLDAPAFIRNFMEPNHYSAVIEGHRFGPPDNVVRGLFDEAIVSWYQDDEFWQSMNALVEPDAESIGKEYAKLEETKDPQQRAMEAARLFRSAGSVIEKKRFAEMMAREVRAMRAADEHLLAETLKLRFGIEWNGSVSDDLVQFWFDSASEAGDTYGAIELKRGLVDLMLMWNETERALDYARSIGGDSWGLLRRIDAYLAIARSTGDGKVLDSIGDELAARSPGRLSEYFSNKIELLREELAGSEEEEK